MNEEVKEEVIEKTDEMAAIEKLMAEKENMVSKEEFEKLKAEKNKLLNEYINKRAVPEKKKETLRPAAEIVKELRQIKDGDMTNRDFIQKSLEYRKSYMAQFGTDPWTDFTNKGSDHANSQTKKVADVFQKLLDENPAPVDFRIKMASIMKDDPNVMAVLSERKKQNKKKK